MKFKVIFFILLLHSCTTGTIQKDFADPYRATGFALIYSEKDYKNQIISGKLEVDELQIAHDKIKKNSIVQITNPENKKSLELKISKKVKYPDFFKIVITRKVAKELGLNESIPYVDIQQKFKNKSFVAKKAITHSEEQKVSEKAPLTKVKIQNISKTNKTKVKKVKKFSIILGEFYSEESANSLKETLEKDYIKKGILKVKKLEKNKFRLLAGPYTSINTLKTVYFKLNKYGFEDLDVQQND
tara:strand:- start:7644 stop:8372 length:729 start_codon:yes stop_codon:yes gene_type:complete